MKTLTLNICLISSLFLLSACSKQGDTKDLQAFVNAVNQRPAAKVEALPKFNIPSAETKPSTIKRDPFAPYVNPKTLATRPDAGRTLEPLEKFPLDSLSMKGTVNDGQQLWALIESPAGLVRVKKGQHIGQNAGQVVKITPAEITISELIPEGEGRWGKRTLTLTLNGSNE